MLDPLGVGFGGDRIDAEPDQEVPDDAVALAAALGQGAAGPGQEDRAVALAAHQPVADQPLDGAVDRRRGDAEALRQIDRAHLAGGCEQIGDQFHVILGDLAGMGVANPSEVLRLVLDPLHLSPAACHCHTPLPPHPNSSGALAITQISLAKNY